MLDPQTLESFIGREREISLYQEWLTNPQSPWILYFYDALSEPGKKGGIGKTWLLRKCVALTREMYKTVAIVTIDFFNIDDRQGIAIARQVINKLRAIYPEWLPKNSLELFASYSGDVEENTDMVVSRSQLSGALAADLHLLETQLELTERTLLLFFDTFELIEKNPIIASLNRSHVFPDNYQFKHIGAVIAGRNPIDWSQPNWLGREAEVRSVALAPFSKQEMIFYLNARLAEIPGQSNELYERTEGRPILIGLVADVLIYQATNLNELLSIPPGMFEARLVAKINDLVNPTNWIILFMAHAYHRFNTVLLDWMLQETNLRALVQPAQYQQILEDLLTLSFVRRSTTGDDFVLHDEMRRLVLKYCWSIQDPDTRYRQEVSKSAVRYYEHELVQTTGTDPLTQTYTIEMLYHKLYLNLDESFNELERLFTDAIDLWMTAYARSLLQEAQLFLERMTAEQRCRLMLLEAQLLKQEENPGEALRRYQFLESQADQEWLVAYRAELLYGLGDCYLDLSRFPEAIECFTQSQTIEQARGNVSRSADILGLLGYICRRQGELEEAVHYYQESIAAYKSIGNMREYAYILNNLGYVYRLQGKIEEALHCCKIGLRIREDLFREKKAPEMSVGLSRATLGIVYLYIRNMTNAEDNFKQALEIYQRAGYKRGAIQMYNRFGQIELLRGRLEEAKNWFQIVEDTLIGTDIEVQTINLIRQGILFRRMGKYAEAIERCEQATVLSQKTHDYFQEAEALIETAKALELAGDHQRSESALLQGVEIAQRYHYYSLLGAAENFLGDTGRVAGKYMQAFEHYVLATHHFANYNALRFNDALRNLSDLLLSIPPAELPNVLHFLQDYWVSHQLDEKYPAFLQTCMSIKDMYLI